MAIINIRKMKLVFAHNTTSRNVVIAALVIPARAPKRITWVVADLPLRCAPIVAAEAPAAAFMAMSKAARIAKARTGRVVSFGLSTFSTQVSRNVGIE